MWIANKVIVIFDVNPKKKKKKEMANMIYFIRKIRSEMRIIFINQRGAGD